MTSIFTKNVGAMTMLEFVLTLFLVQLILAVVLALTGVALRKLGVV